MPSWRLSSACTKVNMHQCKPSNGSRSHWPLCVSKDRANISISVLLLLCLIYQSWMPAPAVKECLFNQPGSPVLPLRCIFPWNLRADTIEPGLPLLTHHTHKYPNLHMYHLSCFIHGFKNHSLIISSDHLPGRYASGFSHYPWLPWPTYVWVCVCVKGEKKGGGWGGAITVHANCPAVAKRQRSISHQMHAQCKKKVITSIS